MEVLFIHILYYWYYTLHILIWYIPLQIILSIVIFNSFNFYTGDQSDSANTFTILRAFCICLHIYLHQWMLHFHIFSCCFLVCINFNLKNSFSVSCKVNIVMMNSLNFCFSGNILFIFPSFLKGNFAQHSIIVCLFFPSALWIYSTPLWLARFLLRNSLTDNLIEVPL